MMGGDRAARQQTGPSWHRTKPWPSQGARSTWQGSRSRRRTLGRLEHGRESHKTRATTAHCERSPTAVAPQVPLLPADLIIDHCKGVVPTFHRGVGCTHAQARSARTARCTTARACNLETCVEMCQGRCILPNLGGAQTPRAKHKHDASMAELTPAASAANIKWW